MSNLTRRAALVRIAVAGSAVTAAGFGIFRFARRSPGHSPSAPPTPAGQPTADEPPGPLSPQTLATLLAATEAIIGVPIERDHYANFLRWRAENLAGYRALCDRLAEALERAAGESAGKPYVACEAAVRLQLADAVTARAPGGLRIAFESMRRQLLVLFSRTDAYLAAGYDGWAGVPRGFADYQHAPRVARR